MEIIKNRDGDKLELTLSCRLDTASSPQLEEVITGSLDGVTELVLDFKGLQYVSSAGLRVLLGAQKAMNKQGKMTLCNVSEVIKDVFDITGFSDILTII